MAKRLKTLDMLTEEEIVTLIGERLCGARNRRGLSMEEFADMIGHAANTIWRWENGRMAISAGKLYRCSLLLRIPIAALFPHEQDTQ